ncbi:MAG: universal stress protein [Acidobacteria bacterium]|nr:universal stress protein [Acidobacteriota bacterium]
MKPRQRRSNNVPKILVAHDASEGAKKAFATALDLAVLCHAELETISIVEVHSHFAATVGEVSEEKEEETKTYAQLKEEIGRMAAARGISVRSATKIGHEVETLINHVRDGGFDLLVVGFMGHSRAFGRIWGGTSQNLARTAPCSVLIVK